jgi:hypothetical protein
MAGRAGAAGAGGAGGSGAPAPAAAAAARPRAVLEAGATRLPVGHSMLLSGSPLQTEKPAIGGACSAGPTGSAGVWLLGGGSGRGGAAAGCRGLACPPQTSRRPASPPLLPPPTAGIGELRHRTGALRSALDAFLPRMAAANDALAARIAAEGAAAVDVETVDGDGAPYIQMVRWFVGVTVQRGATAGPTAGIGEPSASQPSGPPPTPGPHPRPAPLTSPLFPAAFADIHQPPADRCSDGAQRRRCRGAR